VRDGIVEPILGHNTRRFLPYLLTLFFFIFFCNILGLIPIFPAGANITGNIAVTAILALIVMHDAMGVRRETGKQAKVINNMMDLFAELGSDVSPEEKLKEFVGHTPLQVFFGALLGIVVGVVTCNL
jgi:F0F1-type ATP synthase membrane subunit a